MRRNFKYIIVIICVVIVVAIKIFPFGSSLYIVDKSLKLNLPKFSFDIRKEESGKVDFKTVRSKAVVTLEVKRILDKCEKYLCNNKYYYYDKDNSLTIVNFEVKQHLFFNSIEIQYRKGKLNNNECSKIDNSKYLKYSITPVNETGFCYIPDKFKYYDEDGNRHNVYYDCFGNLLFRNGMDEKTYIDQLFGYRWLSVDTLIDFLEEQVKKGSFIKKAFDDKWSIIYRNNDFYLLKCGYKNNDIYIGKDIKNNREYCTFEK